MSSTVKVISIGIVLAISWLIWSGFFKVLLLSLGLFSVFLTLWLLHRMNFFGNETFPFIFTHRLFTFGIWLGKEVVVASMQVTKVILQPKLDLHPQIIEIDMSGTDEFDQALLGNSITLTPGTLTLDVHKDRLLVHALTAEAAEDLAKGEMKRRVLAVRGG